MDPDPSRGGGRSQIVDCSSLLCHYNEPTMENPDFHRRTLIWFDGHGRHDLPWQQPRTPYRVWISEIMLQQTQVATVRGYFSRFLERFPDLQSLAQAPLDEVLRHWSGLGYYARARHLHQAAQQLMSAHQGQFPAELTALMALPGIGRSTAGAILSLGHGQAAAILDGNVKRLLARYFAVRGWPGQSAVLRELWALSERLVQPERPSDFTQALMDLGSLICLAREPRCEICPHLGECAAHRQGTVTQIPEKRPPSSRPVRTRVWLILRSPQGAVYLESRPLEGLWGGLLSPPEFEHLGALTQWLEEQGLSELALHTQPRQRHTFSHFHLDVTPLIADCPADFVLAKTGPGAFIRSDAQERLPAPVRDLLAALGEPGQPIFVPPP